MGNAKEPETNPSIKLPQEALAVDVDPQVLVNDEYSPLVWQRIDDRPIRSQWIIRVVILLGLVGVGNFLYWFFAEDHMGHPILYWMLNFSLFYFLLRILFEWYHYWQLRPPKPGTITKEWTVDMLTTAYPGEPQDMIERTLRAMVAVEYPHTTYLCDEGDDPYLKLLCKELGVVHVTRKIKVNAKAGNINNALKQATGEICVILDPDHVPVPEFLHRTLPYFEDPEVGYVQCIQAYYNRNESFIAKGAAEQTYHFYGPLMMGMHHYNTAQAIGANCTFRRKALDEIGGHAAGLCEDMHTSMQIHAKKYKGYYIPELLTRGLVPHTLSGYFKQQLKWARGSFDLLFNVYPKLFWKFTWRQKLHYLVVPLFYLSGVVGLFDILIPILALIMNQVPWRMEMYDFIIRVLPISICALLIRQYAQKWLLEEHERGFHIMGGILKAGTWWIYLLGFLYSLIGRKVPYIPTPKGDALQDHWTLNMPNIVAIVASLIAIVYGLYIDWSPYSWAMAGFAMFNVMVSSTVVVVGMQQSTQKLYQELYEGAWAKYRLWYYRMRHDILYPSIRRAKFILPVMAVIIGVIYSGLLLKSKFLLLKYENSEAHSLSMPSKYYALSGNPSSTHQSVQSAFSSPQQAIMVNSTETDYNQSNLKAVELLWDSTSVNPQSVYEITSGLEQGKYPVITWSPWLFIDSVYQEYEEKELVFLHDILTGKYDSYILSIVRIVEQYDQPVFINFAPFADEKIARTYEKLALQDSISATHKQKLREEVLANSSEGYANAVTHMYGLFESRGATNTAWMLEVKRQEMIPKLLAEQVTDWIVASIDANKQDSLLVSQSSFSSWLDSYLSLAEEKEVLVFLKDIDGNAFEQAKWLPKYLKEQTLLRGMQGPIEMFKQHDFSISLWEPPKLGKDKGIVSTHLNDAKLPSDSRSYMRKDSSGFTLLVDGEPFYIKGIAYNPEHDWRDGEVPLTRTQLEKDFMLIKEMGGNTIRRYGRTPYDHNIITLAEELELKVIYGFHFDPKVDYLRDHKEKAAYKKEVIELVKKYKDRSSILGWCISNETWGMLRDYYPQPYLSEVRTAYVDLVEEIAAEVHRIDPDHMVMAGMESNQLKAALGQFHHRAPSLDLMGVNSYYEERLGSIHTHITNYFPNKPYLLSEFGPKGYWEKRWSDRDYQGILVEQSGLDKARKYAYDWEMHVERHKGINIGGVAYCWRDRLEGSVTWYGITDWKGRIKPPYYALKNVWTSDSTEFPLFDVYLRRVTHRGGELVAFIDNPEDKRITWEWIVLEDNILAEIPVKINPDLPRFISFTLPKEKENCRVYVFASDEHGNVVTASKGVN